jgi:hypothetical protein
MRTFPQRHGHLENLYRGPGHQALLGGFTSVLPLITIGGVLPETSTPSVGQKKLGMLCA